MSSLTCIKASAVRCQLFPYETDTNKNPLDIDTIY